MSTTVTYKGATLTTVENETKTLTTGGTWMEGDLTLADVTQGGGSVDWSAVLMGTEPTGAISLTLTSAPQDNKFRGCTGLTSVVFVSVPNNTSLNGTFYGCTNLASIDLGNVYQLGTDTFRNCTSLTEVHMNANPCRCNGSYTFQDSGVTEAYFPNMNYSTGRAFQNAHNLVVCDLGSIDMLRGNLFNSAGSLRTLIIRKSTVASLNGWRADDLGGIYSNPTESTIYVPSALVSQYQQASNWSSAYSAGVTFAPIEGSEYEL